MKKFLAPLLLSSLAACHVAQTSSVKEVKESNLRPDSKMSTDNSVGYCEIDWTSEMIADISAANDFDKPLPVDVDAFKKLAKTKLEKVFGKISGETELYYQDMFGRGESAYYDFARLYYLAPLPEELSFLTKDYSISYAVTATGELNIGFAKMSSDWIDFAYPGVIAIFNSDKISKEDFVAKMENLKATVGPKLVWNQGQPIEPSLILWIPVSLPDNADAETLAQFVAVTKILSSDEALENLELDGEAVIGTPTHGKKVAISSTEKTVDMNGLRTVTLKEAKDGIPFTSLPSLAKPFGLGCRIDNPRLGMTAPAEGSESK